MFGYTLAIVLGVVVFVFLLVGVSRAKPRGRDPGSGRPDNQPVGRDSPSADEPTPDRSVTAKPDQVDRAKQVTPSA